MGFTSSSSLSQGQVLHTPYNKYKAGIVLQEMIDNLVLDMIDKDLLTNQLTLVVGYDVENLLDEGISEKYDGEITYDFYGRAVPKHTRATININHKTSSLKTITDEVMKVYNDKVNPILLIRRLNISANSLVDKNDMMKNKNIAQIDLFSIDSDYNKKIENQQKEEDKENRIAKTLLEIKKKYGKNAILRAYNYQEGATARERNEQVGGHRG